MKNLIISSIILLAVSCSNLNTGLHTPNSSTTPTVSPHIEYSETACRQGAGITHVSVKTEREVYNFEPACSSRFYETFVVENTVKCVVESPMCTGFTGLGEMKVHCSSGETHSVSFDCTSL